MICVPGGSGFSSWAGNWMVGVRAVLSLDLDPEVPSYNLVYGSPVLSVP